MIAGQLLQLPAPQAINTAIANVENIGAGGFEDECAERGDKAFFGAGVFLTLAVEPTVEGYQYF